MNAKKIFRIVTVISVVILSTGLLQAQSTQGRKNQVTPAANGNGAVKGSGTPDRVAKWITDNEIGDSEIIETGGNVGIGTINPLFKLTVESPDSSAVLGRSASGLGVLGTSSSSAGVMGTSGSGTGVRAISTSGTGLFATSTSGFAGMFAGKVSVSGSLPGIPNLPNGLFSVSNTGEFGKGILASGGNGSSSLSGGTGVLALGGRNDAGGNVGEGVIGLGGITGPGNSTGFGGTGVIGVGGNSTEFSGGTGVFATGGDHTGSSGFGGAGLSTQGGHGRGAGKRGGYGILATGGLGLDGATNGSAGIFHGDVEITGNLSKGGGSFKIDHPLDPENKYLYHSFVESPDMMNVYNGNITTDVNGEAVVEMPEYFEALNKDFRYQLTVIGTFAQAIVAKKITGNRFVIRTNAPNVEVSRQVTGIRQDGWANKHRIQVEEQKSERERGFYLHPEAFNQPEERGVEWAREPATMNQLKQARQHRSNQ